MITEKVLYGKQIFLRQIELTDCNDNYVRWLNDSEVNQYLETKWYEQNIVTIKEFVESLRNSSHSVLFAIICKEKHIGNIKIGPIHPRYNHADISYFIGEKEYWHRGIATEAIELICDYGFKDLNLNRIEAGAYECAIGSWRALEKCGFKREGVLRKQIYFNNTYIDVYRYAILASEYKERE